MEDYMSYTGESYKDEVSFIYGCDRCPLAYTRNKLVLYRGNPRSDLMIVGEGPGRQEDMKGVPMVGPTGSYLVDILERNGFTREDFYITNTVLCRVPGDADPQQLHLDACAPWLTLQLRLIRPRYILAVGRIAAARLIPEFVARKMRITSTEGKVFRPPHLRGAVVIPIQHPSAIRRRGPAAQEQYEELLQTILSKIRAGQTLVH